MTDSTPSAAAGSHGEAAGHHKLGEFASTAICGNDITSSCLYVSAIAIGAAGKYAWIGLVIVAAMLYLFRKIYAEVVGALPLNGGAYNALLNTTSKSRASVAACLTILSYMATAVISAGEAMHYAAVLLSFLNNSFMGLPLTWWATIGLLGVFTCLTIAGISESASVAIFIFVTHLVTLTLLILFGVCYVFFGGTDTQGYIDRMQEKVVAAEQANEETITLAPGKTAVYPVAEVKAAIASATASLQADDEDAANATLDAIYGRSVWQANRADELHIHEEVEAAAHHDEEHDEAAEVAATDATAAAAEEDDAHSGQHGHGAPKTFVRKNISIFTALFFGFAVALLGISGFESSANFVEEQEDGVFPKTLRNMWWCVLIFNPAMALLALSLIPIDAVQTDQEMKLQLLARMGQVAGGRYFGGILSWLISVDAVLVLSGAVLTSFVGVNGLVRRMTLDRCLPQFLLKQSSRGTTYRILIGFFLLCVSVNYITRGDVDKLAGVYTISFLTVMALFAIGNVLLKIKRDKLPRPVRASWPAVIVAIACVLIGLVGNAVKDTKYLVMFMFYFVPTMGVVAIMLYRIPLLKLCLGAVQATSTALIKPLNNSARAVREKIEDINSQQVVFFTRGDNISNLNNAMRYVMENEDTNRIKVVTVVNNDDEIPPKLEDDLKFLDEAYPQIDIDYVKRVGEFGPDLINELSEEWNVPTNLMFIGSPGGRMPYGLAELGGVRLII